MITLQIMNQMWPQGDRVIPGLKESIVDGARWFQEAGIVTKPQVANAMAQISHECGAGLEVVENLNYRAEALLSQWPSHFNQITANQYAHNPKAIADIAYNGRMGNRPGTDDGWNYRGRGGTQVTGREGYAKLSEKTGLDLLTHPDWVNDTKYFTRCACWDFVLCGCLPYAEPTDEHPHGNVEMVTKRLNGDHIGLSQRQDWLRRWWTVLQD